MKLKIGMRVRYLDTDSNRYYNMRPTLTNATGRIIGGNGECVCVKWDMGGLCCAPRVDSAYYAEYRLQPIVGGF